MCMESTRPCNDNRYIKFYNEQIRLERLTDDCISDKRFDVELFLIYKHGFLFHLAINAK